MDELPKDIEIQGLSEPNPIDRAIAALADRQHGVVARWQLLAMGLGAGAIEHRLRTGRLFMLHKGVYVVGRQSLTPRGYWMGAVLAAGPGAVLSHRSAAALHGIRQSNQVKIDVTIPKGHRSDRPTIRIHSSTFDPEDIATVDGIPVTSVARTILDLAGVLDTDPLLRVVEEADRREKFDLRAMERVMARRPRARGRVKLREILADYRDAPDTRSKLERDFWALIKTAGLPPPQLNTMVAGFLVDVCWPEWCLVVELDGRHFHARRRAFETDRIRDATLQRHGFRILRITYKRLQEQPDAVLADILALARLAA
jgi:very-short-patch-repair endonuclease